MLRPRNGWATQEGGDRVRIRPSVERCYSISDAVALVALVKKLSPLLPANHPRRAGQQGPEGRTCDEDSFDGPCRAYDPRKHGLSGAGVWATWPTHARAQRVQSPDPDGIGKRRTMLLSTRGSTGR